MTKCKECYTQFEGFGKLCPDCKKELQEAKESLTDNQKLFVSDASDQGFDVDYFYSGRGMYGKTCPSIIEERHGDRFGTKANTQSDSMGMDTVIYARY